MEIFYTLVTKGLFLAKRGRPDIMPGNAYLSTKVRSPSENDWDKLINSLRFLKNTYPAVVHGRQLHCKVVLGCFICGE
jgi:hypothetical protein